MKKIKMEKGIRMQEQKVTNMVRRQRLLRGWTQGRLASELYNLCEPQERARGVINANMISRWEKGKYPPSLFWQEKLCQLFNIDIVTLGFVSFLDENVAVTPVLEKTVCSEENALVDNLSISKDYAENSEGIITGDCGRSEFVGPVTPVDELRTFVNRDLTLCLLSLAYIPYGGYHDLQRRMEHILKEFDTVYSSNKEYQVTRRKALSQLATLTMLSPGCDLSGKTAHYEAILISCAASLQACHHIYWSGEREDLRLAFQCVSTYLPLLETVAKRSFICRKEALEQATRCALLKTLLSWDCAGSLETIQYARQAVAYSKEVDDISWQLSAYSKLTWAYFFNNNHFEALMTARDAEDVMRQYESSPRSGQVHQVLKGSIYSTIGLMQACNGIADDQAVGKVEEMEPSNTEYAFTTFKRSGLLLEAGWTYCYRGDHAKVEETLRKRIDLKTLAPRYPQTERGRLEAINTLARSSLRAADRSVQQTEHFWIAGIEGAKATRNEQRFSEAVTTYREMLNVWPREQRVKDLASLIVHW